MGRRHRRRMEDLSLTVIAITFVSIALWVVKKLERLQMGFEQLETKAKETDTSQDSKVTAFEEEVQSCSSRITALEEAIAALSEKMDSSFKTDDLANLVANVEKKMQGAVEVSQQNYHIAQLERKLVEQELEVLREEVGNVTVLSKSMAEFVLKGAGASAEDDDKSEEEA